MTDDLNPVVLSHHVWGFLQHCLSGAGKQVFKSATRQDGFNVWRVLTLEINSRTACVRHALRNQCQQVPQAANNGLVWKAIADWEALYTKYREAGGTAMEFEDRRGQILRILPKDLRKDAFRRLTDFHTIPVLKEWIREQLEYEKEWGYVDKSTIHAKAMEIAEARPEEFEGANEDDVEAFMAFAAGSDDKEVLAVQRKFQKFLQGGSKGFGKGSKGFGKGSGATAGQSTPMKCANCGKTGHSARDCRGPKADLKDRPCFACGEKGHVKANCPNAGKPLKAVEVQAHVVDFGCVETTRWTQPRKTIKAGDQKRTATLGDFMPKSVFTKLAELDATDDEMLEMDTSGDEMVFSEDEESPRDSKMVWPWSSPSQAVNARPAVMKQRLEHTIVPQPVMPPPVPGPDQRVTRRNQRNNSGRKIGIASITKWQCPDKNCQCDQESRHADDGAESGMMVVEVVEPVSKELNVAAEIPLYLDLKVVLDSGAGAHVVNRKECPGYEVRESAMMKSGAAFRAANDSQIKNHGEVRLNIVAKDSGGGIHNISSKFEAADVTRALWSVGLICDAGLNVQFNAAKATVSDKSGTELCVFPRENGLYVATVQIANPRHPDFRRQGP